MLNVIMLSVIMLNVIMLNVVAPKTKTGEVDEFLLSCFLYARCARNTSAGLHVYASAEAYPHGKGAGCSTVSLLTKLARFVNERRNIDMLQNGICLGGEFKEVYCMLSFPCLRESVP